MEATIIPDSVKHYPVLLKEIISVISPQHGGTFIDCTFGQGGHSKEILKYKKTKVIGLDRDSNSQKIAEKLYNDLMSQRFEDVLDIKLIRTALKIKAEGKTIPLILIIKLFSIADVCWRIEVCAYLK